MERDDLVDVVNSSYRRCVDSKDFIEDFYESFMSKSDAIRAKFAQTDMEHQHHALRNGLEYMIMFAAGSSIAAAKVEDLGRTHDRNHRNIPASMYSVWIESLMATIAKHDPQYTKDLDRAWRDVLGHGVRRIKGMF